MSWQPIDTVPKNGKRVLLTKENELYLGYFIVSINQWWVSNGVQSDSVVMESMTHWHEVPGLPTISR